MCEIVAHELERVRLVARGDDRERAILLERPGDVAHLAVDARRQRRLGETRPIAAATSAGVVPRSTSRTDPSGSEILMSSVIAKGGSGKAAAPQ